MLAEVLQYLAPEKGEVIVDGTLGAGGHAEAVLERIAPGGRLIGIDRDPAAVAEARKRLDPLGSAVSIHRENYRDMQSVLDGEGLETVDGILLDLGLSSMQVDDPDRGFSFRSDGPLDMRMGPDATQKAEEIVNTETEQELARIIFRYGDERWARRIAHFIVEARERRPLQTTRELSKVVEDAVPVSARRGRKHPARKTFQALRVAVNNELEDLREGIIAGVERLAPSGRIVVLSYQSHEDRIVKRTFNSLAGGLDYPPGGPLESLPVLEVLTRRPMRASEKEIEDNPRARSAKLRAAERRAG
jgi:16S rRNA (cytosine1402-N4)-methyltransferase